MTKLELIAALKNMPPALKRVVFFTALVGVVCIGLLAVVIVPQMKRLSSLSEEFEEANTTFNRTHKNISEIGNLRKEVAEAEKNLAEMTSTGILEPLLGSYEMRALRLIAPFAEQAGVTLITDSVRCLPQLPIYSPEAVTVGRFYARQPVEFSGKGSYAQITDFLKEIETKMPFVSVSSLRILGQDRTPEEHIMSISLEWPVFAEIKPTVKGEKKK